MNISTKPLVVEVWSDFVCPWCWIAKRRFDKALAAFEHRDLVQVNLRAYRIAANYQPESFAAALLRKFRDPAAAQGMMDAVRQHGAAEGLDYRFDTMQFGDTIDAHMLVKAVEDEALQKLLVEALYEQSVTHGASLFDRSSLAQIATQAGVPAQLVQDAWAAPGLRQLVQRMSPPACRCSFSATAATFPAPSPRMCLPKRSTGCTTGRRWRCRICRDRCAGWTAARSEPNAKRQGHAAFGACPCHISTNLD